eukprot:gene21205-25475_t
MARSGWVGAQWLRWFDVESVQHCAGVLLGLYIRGGNAELLGSCTGQLIGDLVGLLQETVTQLRMHAKKKEDSEVFMKVDVSKEEYDPEQHQLLQHIFTQGAYAMWGCIE